MSALVALGVKPGDRVATFSWNTQQHLEAYVGIPCMGAVHHTLNIRLFPADLAYVVEHAQDSVVIVDRSLWPAWEKVGANVGTTIVVPDGPEPVPPGALDYEELLAKHDPMTDLPAIPEEQAAAACYTSGTTGRPKGVLYTHRSNLLHAFAITGVDTLALSERDVVFPLVPMFHANAWGLPWGCLFAGADLVLPGRFMTPDAQLELLIDRGVTLGAGVPTTWNLLLDPMRKAKGRYPRLGRVLCGGSAVPPALQKAFADELGVRLLHAWGMTEMSPLGSICRPLAKHEGHPDELLASQGRPAPFVEMRLVRDDGTEAPWDGVSLGEVQVRGPWIASAYFVDGAPPDKFQEGWLRTGDVGTLDPDGYLRIADRTKDLVKSGGEWISSVELEGHLMAHPGVAEAAVIAVPHPRWDERPLACVVVRPAGALAGKDAAAREALLEFLRPRIAKWWLPDDVAFLDEVPKTSVGKFDKKVLRERFRDYRFTS